MPRAPCPDTTPDDPDVRAALDALAAGLHDDEQYDALVQAALDAGASADDIRHATGGPL